MNPRREEQRKKTRRKILEVAKELFFTEGYTAVSTDRIAEQAEVSKGTIFHHFSTKEALGLAAIEDFMLNYNKLLPENIQQLDTDDTLRIFLTETLTIESEAPGFMKMLVWFMFHLSEVNQTDPNYTYMLKIMEDILFPYVGIVNELLSKHDCKNTKLRSLLLLALLDGLSLYLSNFSKLADIDPELTSLLKHHDLLVDEIIEMFTSEKVQKGSK